ncbi:hypothetical protein LDENG_00257320 [Lucifuga dentata]|nr:hypothetical protein LDENG_00257320 [Lucifuga dentata]
MGDYPYPVSVEGSWSPAQTGSLKNKLQIYFQSRKKSDGGDCRVEVEEHREAARATVFFRSPDVRDRVLTRQNHEVVLEKQTVTLRVFSPSNLPETENLSEKTTSGMSDPQGQRSETQPENGASAPDREERVEVVAVVLENVSDSMTFDLLSMLVENVSGLDETRYDLETIWESSSAVVTFSEPTDVERFLAAAQNSPKLQKHGLSTRPLQAATAIRVENVPATVAKDMLELYFEKSWTLPLSVSMIPEEEAAIVTFSDPKVVGSICMQEKHVMHSMSMKVFPYYESLDVVLYGKWRPAWKLPEPFSESVDHAVWKFLLMKKLIKSINDQMRPYFCTVNLDRPEVRLSPLPSLLRQKGLTAKHINDWKSNVQQAFYQKMSQYIAFECPTNASAWKVAEKDIRSVVRDDAVLVLDASRRSLTVAGRVEDVKRVRVSIEDIILKVVSHVNRKTNGISEVMDVSPAMFYILKQDGFNRAVMDISPEMQVCYSDVAGKLTVSGLSEEVYQAKAWILERKMGMTKKRLDLDPLLLDFLRKVNPMDMSHDLFTSQGISALYSIEPSGVFLTGSSDSVLADAENRVKMVLSLETLEVEDQEVLRMPEWTELNQQLSDTYNSSKKRTVIIQVHPEDRQEVTVTGFLNPVKEVSRSLKEFILNFSRVQETIRVVSSAVLQFTEEKKSLDWSRLAKAHDVSFRFDSGRQRIVVSGARLHVQKARVSCQELVSALSTGSFKVDKPGARKFFLSQGHPLLSTVMKDFSCVVVLRTENEEEEEEEGDEEEAVCYCRVQTSAGVVVSVSKADICSFSADAVVNAANEELQHTGGLALALLKAAGPQLQKISNDYIARKGKLRPGDAVVTDSCNLPAKYVVHAVGPRFSDSDRKTAVSRLKLTVTESLRQAERARCRSVALPAISSGVFGFPVDLCAETVAHAVREYCDGLTGPLFLTEIHLVDNNDNTVRTLATAVHKEFTDLRPTMTVPGVRGGGASSGQRRGRGGLSNILRRSNDKGRGQGRRGGGGGVFGRMGAEAQGGLQEHRGHARPEGQGRMEQTTAEGLKIVLWKGRIQDQTTDVIVNTISENLNLKQGAVSMAILEAAGPGLQGAVRSAAGAATLRHGEVVITDACNMTCRRIFHAVCPFWDGGDGRAEEELMSIIRFCLDMAEKLQMTSLSFPAIGTGNMSFPRDMVSKVLLKEIHDYSNRKCPQHLKVVAIVVHPSDSQTMECFTRKFKGQPQRSIRPEAHDYEESSHGISVSQSQQSSVSFGQVLSPTLGVYQMQMGQLTLEVSSGDITKETSDVIVNASNKHFNLKSGVSKAILDSAGVTVEQECSRIVNSPGYQQRMLILTSAGLLPNKAIVHVVGTNEPSHIRNVVHAVILTSAGLLPNKAIVHVVGTNEPSHIRNVVHAVLNVCEENQLSSVSFPALGTGQGGADPSAVADAMIDAVVDFVRKKHSKFVRNVKVLIFQKSMMMEFHKSMRRREGEAVEEKSFYTKLKDTMSFLFFGTNEKRADHLNLEVEEFEPAVFDLCADNAKAVSQAKRRIEELIVSEQAARIITDPFISQLSQEDLDQLKALQRKLTVCIRLEMEEDQKPRIHLEGLTRDVLTAEFTVREVIQKVEREENLKQKAMLLSKLVEWQYSRQGGSLQPFDIYTNLSLEEALKKGENVKIRIDNESYTTDLMLKKATRGSKQVELLRKDLKDDAALPAHWEDMKGSLMERFPLAAGSKEYNVVEQEFTKTMLQANIISIERVQNPTLWRSYQLLKKHMEVKNKHTNNEMQLFHGTCSDAVDLINNQGFNRSYAGAHGTMYGNGSYFAADPSYSARGYAKPDASGRKRMYLARVLVGDFTQGKAGLITPPSKSSRNAVDLYDSVTDNTANPSMFVIFSDIQAYPEYLITFT